MPGEIDRLNGIYADAGLRGAVRVEVALQAARYVQEYSGMGFGHIIDDDIDVEGLMFYRGSRLDKLISFRVPTWIMIKINEGIMKEKAR